MKGREFAVDVNNGVYTVQFVIGSVNSNTTNVVIEDKYEGKPESRKDPSTES